MVTWQQADPLYGPDGSILAIVPSQHEALLLPPEHVVRQPEDPIKSSEELQRDAMIALAIPPEINALYAVEKAENVDPLPSDERHITLVYLPGDDKPVDAARLRQATRRWLAESDWPPLEGRPQGWGTFNPGKNKKNVLWMGWDIPGLPEMRQDLVEMLGAEGFEVSEDHGFVPHETVAYVDGPLRGIPQFPTDMPGNVFDNVVVAHGDDWRAYDFPMTMALRDGASISLVAALEMAAERDRGLVAAGGADRSWLIALDRELFSKGATSTLSPASGPLALAADATVGVLDPIADVSVAAGVSEPGIGPALGVDLVRDGFQVIRVDAMQDSAKVIQVPFGLWSHASPVFGERANASLPDKAVGEMKNALPANAAVAANGIDVARPQQTRSEVGAKVRNGADLRTGSDGFLASSSLAGSRGGGVAGSPFDFVVTKAESGRRILDLPLAIFDRARSSGQGSTLAFLENLNGRRIAIDLETSIVTAAEFLGEDGPVAVIYGADGRTWLASASLWVSGFTPTFVVGTAPSSDFRRLRTIFNAADGHWSSLVAAGSIKGHTTGAAALKKYWLTGRGAAKIRWGTQGDWKRCFRHLSKYMGPRAKGYCAILHHDATGTWTGDMEHRIKHGWGGRSGEYWRRVAARSNANLDPLGNTDRIIEPKAGLWTRTS